MDNPCGAVSSSAARLDPCNCLWKDPVRIWAPKAGSMSENAQGDGAVWHFPSIREGVASSPPSSPFILHPAFIPKQLALLAVARKLLLALNEMMRSGQPWRAANAAVSA
jgi:hypothetical protein